MSRRRVAVAVVVLLALAPTAAQAHLVSTGLGPLYDGAAHVATSPEDVLPVVGLGLHAGLRGPAPSRAMLAVLVGAWVAGGALGWAGLAPAPVTAAAATAALFLAVGALLAFDARRSAPAGLAVALALGLVRGCADVVGAKEVGALVGAPAAAFTLFAVAASVTLPLTRTWMRIAARVAGSWLGATGLLLAGWILRYGARAV